MRHRFLTADVFTSERFGGNQLAVFPDARAISEQHLLSITREFNYSETTFVYPPVDARHTRRVRIFTPGGEVPFAGHPTVGTAFVLASIGEVPLTGPETRITFEEGVGPVPVMIRATDGIPTFSQLSVAQLPEFGPPPPSREQLAAVLSLSADDLLDGKWGAQGVSCGLPFLVVPLRNRDAVARARVNLDAWERTLRGAWASEPCVFARGGEREGSDLRARVFVPGLNVPEDPATGSAMTCLGGYLAQRDDREGTLRWRAEQGFEMGRPSLLDIEVDRSAGRIVAVRVGGATVLVSEGHMEVGS
ncbi:MAG: phenazine biosynthesis protein PhzF family [Gemmatimonadetes bacterium]|nr:phenazine biosynthesis protein PhzF family [Gemmatimonadota bacterium]